jgi:hypothetical protein
VASSGQGAAAAQLAAALEASTKLLSEASTGRLSLVLPALRLRMDGVKFAFVPGHTTTGFVVADAADAGGGDGSSGDSDSEHAAPPPQQLGWLVVRANS